MADIDREEYDEELERREYRHKRRVRNQIIAYVVSGIILAVALVGAGLGVSKVVSVFSDKKHAEELQAQLEELEAEEPVIIEAPVATPEAEEPIEEIDPLTEIVEGCISEMPLEDKVAGLFMVTPESITGVDVAVKAGDSTKEVLSKYSVGGLVYHKQNMKSEEQFKEMVNNTQSYSKYTLFFAVAEEGGENSPVAKSGLAENVGTMAAIGESADATKAKEAGSTVAGYLSEYGINVNLAPVSDVILEGNTTLEDRSFGNNAGEVAVMVAANVEGLEEGGVSACLKHFPGIGSTTEDASAGMAVSEKTLEDFETTDFLSFQAGIDAGADFVMVSHLSVPGITGDNTPSSVSETVITEVLRGQMGFEGVVITDAMNVAAITDYYTADEAAVKAILAGADMIMMPEDFELAYNGVLEAVNNGTISEERINESLRRIYRVKCQDKVAE